MTFPFVFTGIFSKFFFKSVNLFKEICVPKLSLPNIPISPFYKLDIDPRITLSPWVGSPCFASWASFQWFQRGSPIQGENRAGGSCDHRQQTLQEKHHVEITDQQGTWFFSLHPQSFLLFLCVDLMHALAHSWTQTFPICFFSLTWFHHAVVDFLIVNALEFIPLSADDEGVRVGGSGVSVFARSHLRGISIALINTNITYS